MRCRNLPACGWEGFSVQLPPGVASSSVLLPLLEGFHIKRMWKVRVGRLKRRDIATINTALSFSRLFHLIESGFAQHFIKISEIESGAMLPVAEHEVGKASADGIKMVWEGIVEPVGAILVVSNDRIPQIGNDNPQAAAGLQ